MERKKVVKILKRYGTLAREIKQCEAEINELEKIAGSSENARPRLCELAERLENLVSFKEAVERVVDRLPYSERTICVCQYMWGWSWERTAFQVSYSKRNAQLLLSKKLLTIGKAFDEEKAITEFMKKYSDV